jgi:hypothetical protein
VVRERVGGVMKVTCDAFVDLETDRLVKIIVGSEASCADPALGGFVFNEEVMSVRARATP